MITYIALALGSAAFGLSTLNTVLTLKGRGRLNLLEEQADTQFVTREEVGGAFQQISQAEQIKEAVLYNRLDSIEKAITAVRPVFGSGMGLGGGAQAGQSAPTDPAQLNAVLTQQLAALNQRLQQGMNQQLPS